MHFLGFGGDSGSGGVWGEGRLCLVHFGGEVWVFWYFCQVYPCVGPWIPLELMPLEVLRDVWGSGGEWGEVEPCLV